MKIDRNKILNKYGKRCGYCGTDIPSVTGTLRKLIAEQEKTNSRFIEARDAFWKILKDSINKDVNTEDIKEMLIQHILTADIFNTIFNSSYYHRENNIARELEKVLDTFFSRAVRESTLEKIHREYLNPIQRTAYSISDHHEKQKFLKVFYENFYKSYNPKAADKLGVVYTPNEIVRFMIEGTDHLLYEHFNKYIHDEGVDLLDPATGTGTFICDLIDYIKKDRLEYKYKNEIHANELAILPYYIANLNIEFTYSQKMGAYEEFKNLCLVDTLDNSDWFSRKGEQDLFVMNAENADRIKKQNRKEISVIIGNPPYNANQQNENDNNKNREYRLIDDRIKQTYIKLSTAQKTKVYDMYSRFFRWAMDRLSENGIISFVTNRSFIDSRTFDGFRKYIQDNFDFAYIIDTKSDVRSNPKIAGTTHNVFGIQAGIAILFLIKKKQTAKRKHLCRIHYISLDDYWLKEKKLLWLATNHFKDIIFEKIEPDKNNNWIKIKDNDFEKLISLCNKNVKSGNNKDSVFESFSLGVATNRDDWVYDLSKEYLEKKVRYLIDFYNKSIDNHSDSENQTNIKWTRAVKRDLLKGVRYKYQEELIIDVLYRPFQRKKLYFSRELNEMPSLQRKFFAEKADKENFLISFTDPNSQKPFMSLASKSIVDLHLNGAAAGTQCLPLYTYDAEGNRQENITDWALEKFQYHYKDSSIKKDNIFHYAYAVLHYPAYRKKYELNLKRGYPRIPFYKDFSKWAGWGKKLMEIHIEYETAKQYKLKVQNAKEKDAVPEPKAKLKADRENGIIVLDENTSLSGIPEEAWEYRLGNRSALEWILDQYKEKKPKDPTIAEKFNTYKFADYKNQVIELLKKVCTVSVETVRILKEMEGEA